MVVGGSNTAITISGRLGYCEDSVGKAFGFTGVNNFITLKLTVTDADDTATLTLEKDGDGKINSYTKTAFDGADYIYLVLDGNGKKFTAKVKATDKSTEKVITITNSALLDLKPDESADIPFGTEINFNEEVTVNPDIMSIDIEATTDAAISYIKQIVLIGDNMMYKNNGNPVQVYNTDTKWADEQYKKIVCVENHTFKDDTEKEWWTTNSDVKAKE